MMSIVHIGTAYLQIVLMRICEYHAYQCPPTMPQEGIGAGKSDVDVVPPKFGLLPLTKLVLALTHSR